MCWVYNVVKKHVRLTEIAISLIFNYTAKTPGQVIIGRAAIKNIIAATDLTGYCYFYHSPLIVPQTPADHWCSQDNEEWNLYLLSCVWVFVTSWYRSKYFPLLHPPPLALMTTRHQPGYYDSPTTTTHLPNNLLTNLVWLWVFKQNPSCHKIQLFVGTSLHLHSTFFMIRSVCLFPQCLAMIDNINGNPGWKRIWFLETSRW